MPGYEFRQPQVTTTRHMATDEDAKGRAGRLAKRHNCPVELWTTAGAYLTTAQPSPTHFRGYRFEART